MAWNPSPEIADLRELSRKWKMHQIVVLAINQQTGVFKVNTYGETRALCDQAGTIGGQIHDMIASGKIEIDRL